MTNDKGKDSKENQPLGDEDFETFMKAVEDMDPEEARIMFQNIIAEMEEAGESIPFPMRLLTSDVLYGLYETPVGLVYGIGGLGQLLLTGFIGPEDIDELGDAETVIQAIMDDFEENISTAKTIRNDEAIGEMIQNALDGTYEVQDDVFEAMEATELNASFGKS